jgi:23S rRNA (uracil747-C5)-methyltransferase
MKTFCSYFNSKTCGSCKYISLEYNDQIKSKEESLLRELSQFSNWTMLPSVSSSPLEFRNKAKLVVTGSLEEPIIGLAGSTDIDLGREILNCPIHHPHINLILKSIPDFIKVAKLIPYSITKRTGELKGLIIYYSPESNEAYLRFVLRSKESYDRIKKNASTLLGLHPFLKCLSVNIQPLPQAILEGEEEIFVTETRSIRHKLGPIEFTLHPNAFVQTNKEVSQKLYESAASWVKSLKIKKFMELYCGQGAFSFFCSPFTESSWGVEINQQAVLQAEQTASSLKLSNLHFQASPAAHIFDEIQKIEPDLLLVNPPRAGLMEASKVVNESKAEYLIYSSCSLTSFKKDLNILKMKYDLIQIQIFDMFPHTEHFELLALLKASSKSGLTSEGP